MAYHGKVDGTFIDLGKGGVRRLKEHLHVAVLVRTSWW